MSLWGWLASLLSKPVPAAPAAPGGVPVAAVGDAAPLVPPAAVAIVAEFEGFRAAPYRCPADVPTIGYGTTRYPDGRRVSLTDPACTEAQARSWLQHDLEGAARAVDRLVTVPLDAEQRSALISWIYNVGEGAAASSTLVRLLNQGDYGSVPGQLARWDKAGGKVLAGLTRRRAAEAALWA